MRLARALRHAIRPYIRDRAALALEYLTLRQLRLVAGYLADSSQPKEMETCIKSLDAVVSTGKPDRSNTRSIALFAGRTSASNREMPCARPISTRCLNRVVARPCP